MKASILIADADPSILALLTAILEKNGMRVLRARTGDEALQIVNRQYIDVDLLLCNRNFDDSELAARVRDARPALPVLSMSAGTDGSVLRIGLDRRIGYEENFDGNIVQAIRSALSTPKALGAARTN